MLEVSIRIREDQIEQIIERERPKRVGLQAPDGLVNKLLELSENIEKKHPVEVVMLLDPSYGTCDLSNFDAKRLGLDLVFNLGHSVNIPKIGSSTYMIDVTYDVDFRPTLNKLVDRIDGMYRRVGVTTISNHRLQLKTAVDYLNTHGLKAVIGHSEGFLFDGQVFGCNYFSAKTIVNDVDAFVFLGQSRFHAVGIRLCTRKPTYMLDPFMNEVEEMSEEADHIERRAILSVLKAKDAQTFGIIVGVKEGQFFKKQAEELRDRLSRLGKKTFMFSMREVTAHRLKVIRDVDVFIETACPRVGLDDEDFDRPMLSYEQGLGLIRLLEGKELGDMFDSGFWV